MLPTETPRTASPQHDDDGRRRLLLLVNGEWAPGPGGGFRDQARARRSRARRAIEGRVVLAYRLAFGRSPEADETAEADRFPGPTGTIDGSGTPSSGCRG